MKLDFKLKLAPKDKRLLLTILIVVILAVGFFGYRFIKNGVDEIDAQTAELEAIKADLQEKYNHKSEYVLKTDIYNELYSRIINSYASGLTEPSAIMDMVDIEDSTGTWINQVAFSNVGVLYEFGNITSTNPETQGSAVYSTDFIGTGAMHTLAYECDYEQLKTLINRINDTDKKYKIGSMTLSFNEADETLIGSMTLNYYAVTGSNRVWIDPDIPGVSQGSENPFISDTYTTNPVDKTYLDTMKNDYDVYVALNSSASDVDSIVVALKSDVVGTTRVSTDSNSKENVQINVSGSAGNYKVSYQVGDSTYPASDYVEGAPILVGDTLDILVVSKNRIDENDKCVAMLTVVNDTDMELNLGILNDDDENPRCVIEKTVGNINIYQ